MNTQEILRRTDDYIYSNPVTGLLTRWGHNICSNFRQFDIEGSIILDLGCGPGRHSKFVTKAKYIGLDNMPEMVERVGKRAILGDAYNLPFKDNSIPSIVSSGLLEHLVDIEEALWEIRRVLMKNGELLLLQPCEGFLYKIGRRLTTQRYIEKNFGEDYTSYIQEEHINKCSEVLEKTGKVLTLTNKVGIPFLLPWIGINAYIVGRYIKRAGELGTSHISRCSSV